MPLTRDCSPGPVTDLNTERLALRPVDTDEAERIVTRQPGPQDSWARDFPFDGDVIGATMFLRASTAHGDQHPFGHYVIIRIANGQAIGGIGFKGQPDNGTAEIGYGHSPDRDAGMASQPRPSEHSSTLLVSTECRASSPIRIGTTPRPSGPSSTRASRRPARIFLYELNV